MLIILNFVPCSFPFLQMPRDGHLYNPTKIAELWLKKAKLDPKKVEQNKEKFHVLSDGMGRKIKDSVKLDAFLHKKAIPITKFSFPAFAKSIRILHQARVEDTKLRIPLYKEPEFPLLLRFLDNRKDARKNFLQANNFEAEPPQQKIHMDVLRQITLKNDKLDFSNPKRAKLASSWAKERFLKTETYLAGTKLMSELLLPPPLQGFKTPLASGIIFSGTVFQEDIRHKKRIKNMEKIKSTSKRI